MIAWKNSDYFMTPNTFTLDRVMQWHRTYNNAYPYRFKVLGLLIFSSKVLKEAIINFTKGWAYSLYMFLRDSYSVPSSELNADRE